MRKILNLDINIIFALELAVFALIIFGVAPRWAALPLTAVLAVYSIAAPLEDGLVFFVRSIPFFVALPLAGSFDSLNGWRIISAVLFLKWLWPKAGFKVWRLPGMFLSGLKSLKTQGKLLLALFLLIIFSVSRASDTVLAVKRVIYFLNLSLVGTVIYNVCRIRPEFRERIIKNLAWPVGIAALFGLGQVVSTYFVDIYQFMRIFGEGIQCRQFGVQWCSIAVQVGNTWFAYFGEQLSLRVFSLFPDSHSFPIFLLLGLPSVFAVIFKKPAWFKAAVVSLIFLAAILSGTRGIWAASAIAVLAAGFFILLLKRAGLFQHKKFLIRFSSYLVLFFLLFAAAFPIFASPQFLVSKGNDLLLRNRIKSIIDFGETSNSQRIEIWKKTLASIVRRPLLGVGIGNFPVVLNQDLRLAKAGSSAHNLYLQIAAETGVPAFLLFLWLILVLIKNNFKYFTAAEIPSVKAVFYGVTLFFLPWVLAYLLTDAALFDERAFLIFTVVVAMLF